MKILRPIGGTAGIFFPIGKVEKNGTCENATKECLKYCCANWGIDHNEEYRVLDKEKQLIYKEFINKPIFDLCSKILKEMKELRCDILNWFTSGDCMDKDIERISTIMKLLKENSSIYQNGFTKNGELFGKIYNLNRVHIVHTVKSRSEIGMGCAKIFAVCDYNHGTTKLYTQQQIDIGSCGSVEFKIKNLKFVNDCRTCLRLQKGCFTNLKELDE